MNRLLLIFIVLILFSTKGICQQLPQYSQWFYHQFALNPAHAGIKSCLDFQMLYRAQWIGLEGSPKSGFVTASMPIKSKQRNIYSARHGWGIRVENDQIGPFSMNRFNLAYAGHFNFTTDTRLSLGLYGGAVQIGVNPSKMTTLESDPLIHNDANFIVPDAHFGAWWNGKDYYLGLMVHNLIGFPWSEVGNNSRFRFHTGFNGGYRLKMNDNFTFLPSGMLRIPIVGPMDADLNLIFDYKNQFAFGAGIRTQDALIFFASFKLKERLSIHYSFDYTVSKLQKVSSNTHEISLNFTTCKPQSRSTSACPLFE